MNNLIIFSKNRPCQLNLLLDSISKYSNTLFNNITVLYKFDIEFNSGYELLKQRHHDICFRPEKQFRNDLLSLIDPLYSTTTFMVDDAVIYSDINQYKQLIEISLNSSVVCFSLRLGFNCKYSHPADLHYNIGEYYETEHLIEFDYTNQRGDFNYPLSTDGHIFQTNLILSLLKQIDFYNPNTLESALQIFTKSNSLPKKIVSFKESKLVSIPVNLVNDTFNNRNGLEFYMSEKELNEKYLNGNIIDLDSLNFTNINGPHKEIKYEFKKN